MSNIQFLNIDLDIESEEDISPIIREWGERISVHRNEFLGDRYFGTFETLRSGVSEIIKEYFDLVEGLSPSARAVWDAAEKRVFDFGYESGTQPGNFHSEISAECVARLAKIGGSVVVTIYPVPAT